MTNIYNKVVIYPNGTLEGNWYEESVLRQKTGEGRTSRGTKFGKRTFDIINPSNYKSDVSHDDTYKRVIMSEKVNPTDYTTSNSAYGNPNNLQEKQKSLDELRFKTYSQAK